MKKLVLSTILLMMVASTTQACMNTYEFELSYPPDKADIKQQITQYQQKKSNDLESLNDYGVLLTYDRQYQKAIDVFLNIEKKFPNKAKTAANLGTAYELNGQTLNAKKWIAIGMQRDPKIHEGSEWIHLKILDAQLEQNKDSKWIQSHDVIGLDFGEKAAPEAKLKSIKINDQVYDLARILEDSNTQMYQRLQFVEYDPITAQIVFNMANIEALDYNLEGDTVQVLYWRAKKLGYSDPKLLEQRMEYIENSKWYAVKAFFSKFTGLFKDLWQIVFA